MRTTFRHLTQANCDYDEAKRILRELRSGARAEVVLDSALPMRPGAEFTVSSEGRINGTLLLMDEAVAVAFVLVDISTESGEPGRVRYKITARNVSEAPEQFVAWFVGYRLL